MGHDPKLLGLAMYYLGWRDTRHRSLTVETFVELAGVPELVEQLRAVVDAILAVAPADRSSYPTAEERADPVRALGQARLAALDTK